MNYNLILKEIDDIYRIINLNKKILISLEGKEEILFKKSVNKNLTLEIYTFWENFCKELVYDCYLNYKKIIIDKEFLVGYFEHVQEKSFVRRLFLESIDDNKIDIKKEILCASNNLNFKQLNELFQRIRFSSNDFKKHVNDFKSLDRVIRRLKEECIFPKFKEIKSSPSTVEYLEAYLDLIVENRNKVAHQYNIDEIYTLEQFEVILDFIKILVFIVFEFCTSQIIKKSKDKEEAISKRIFPVGVIRSNSGGKTAIIGVKNNTRKVMNKDTQLYFYDKSKNIYRMTNILKIVEDGNERCEMLPTNSYSIEIDTHAAVKIKNKRFEIHKITHKYNPFDYKVVV
ncbi:MAG: HEPN domain-containing protein [Paraclostridium sp.]